MAAIWERSITITQNADAPFSWGYSSFTKTVPPSAITASVPYSFGGTTVKFSINETNSPSSPQLLQLTSTSGAITFSTATVNGISVATVNWNIPNATTENLPVGTWWFDLLWINGSKNIYLAEGDCVIQGTAGR